MNHLTMLLQMAQTFIVGEDRSMAFVASMEGFVVDHFLDSEVYEFLAEGLSLYRPWAGPPYWTEEDMAQLLEEFVQAFGDSRGV